MAIERLLDAIVFLMLDEVPLEGLLFRSVYANRVGLGGSIIEDAKVRSREGRGGDLVSTSELSFRAFRVGERIRMTFPEPSRYEA